ncbi:CMP/dCMP deaminase family protein [Protomyces lactucae-debilis]|uniref:CMP/dCMP deaminase family protein n=1 Tax=Protomyces lactucae-debilis TaxID=2754530 RepID=A0A1Y2FSZ5_PROLT|nr:CMP/dCMP deaminase family protein [Protomyces lactucae-debilis]ORY87123.1 CMP/dCMP deaminase family protein [Protomyces lactucae-debilis]
MQAAMDEARKSIYTPTAFCVGCVLVQGDKIVATGYSRELEGNTHAEQCALMKLPADAKDLDCYTTMEPCSERLSGNLPCVDRLIASGRIKRVLQGVAEPADFVACTGSTRLRDAGIEVIHIPGYEEEALAIARGEAK